MLLFFCRKQLEQVQLNLYKDWVCFRAGDSWSCLFLIKYYPCKWHTHFFLFNCHGWGIKSMHQFNKMLSSAGHAKCNQSAVARMATRHRGALLTLGKRHSGWALFHSKRKKQLKKSNRCFIQWARCLIHKQKWRAVKERSQYTVIFNWCKFDVQTISGQFPHICVHQQEEKQLGC